MEHIVTVSVPDGTMSYKKMGDGPALIMLPDHGRTMDHWPPALVYKLAQKHTLYIVDYPGVGTAKLSNPLFSFDSLTKDIMIMMRKSKIKKANVMGFSLGGAVALKLASQYPRSIQHLICIATTGGGHLASDLSDPVLQLFDCMKTAKTSEEIKSCHLRLFEFLLPHRTSKSNVEKMRKMITSGGSVPQSILERFVDLEKDWWLGGLGEEKLTQIVQPTLVLHGKEDHFVPIENGLNLAKTIPDASLIRYPGAGHGLLYQYPLAVAKLINLFTTMSASRWQH